MSAGTVTRAIAVVRLALGQQPLDDLDVPLSALGLVDHLVVPIEAEPGQAVEDGVDRLLGRAHPVGVFDAQAEPTTLAARIEPVEQRRAGAADVKESRGRGGKACDDGAHLGDVSGVVRFAADVAYTVARVANPLCPTLTGALQSPAAA